MGRVTPKQAPPAAARQQQSRTVLVSFLGSIVRPLGNWMPIAGTIELMGQFGLDAPSVRTAVFRLKKRGWLASETRSGSRGYALTPIALKALAAGDEIIWHARQPADLADGWCIVSFSVPESARGKRDQLRGHLAALGFGNVGAAMWIAPPACGRPPTRPSPSSGSPRTAAIFVGDYVGGRDLPGLLRDSWDLVEIDRRYQEFTERFADEARQLGADVEGLGRVRDLRIRLAGPPAHAVVRLTPGPLPAAAASCLLHEAVLRQCPQVEGAIRRRLAEHLAGLGRGQGPGLPEGLKQGPAHRMGQGPDGLRVS